MVRDAGFEPATPTVSRAWKTSTKGRFSRTAESVAGFVAYSCSANVRSMPKMITTNMTHVVQCVVTTCSQNREMLARV